MVWEDGGRNPASYPIRDEVNTRDISMKIADIKKYYILILYFVVMILLSAFEYCDDHFLLIIPNILNYMIPSIELTAINTTNKNLARLILACSWLLVLPTSYYSIKRNSHLFNIVKFNNIIRVQVGLRNTLACYLLFSTCIIGLMFFAIRYSPLGGYSGEELLYQISRNAYSIYIYLWVWHYTFIQCIYINIIYICTQH